MLPFERGVGMRRWRFVFLLLVVSLPASEAAAPAPRTILVLGDSLSAAFGIDVRAGWVALLEQRLAREKLDYRVVNASISGDTSAAGLARLPLLLDRYRPVVLIVELGGNDGLRGQVPEQTKHNIALIAAKAKARGVRVLLVGVPLPPNYGHRYLERFQRIFGEIATEQGVTLVPSIVAGVADDRALMQRDGIHPTAQAQPRMLENVWRELRPLL
jgi:acyl-CoA thioesterase-1